ncbi:MAG: hypothetical protein BMS9Abin31_0568 [Gammaproteobacteria bacterium]|nr:MAG: hypothetical protein BMS9Abin31_0568 [Gammaproteobacteria bacterium]
MIDSILINEQAGSFSRRQQIFYRYIFFVLIDLTVLNLFNEYWDNVFIEYFSISLLAALLLQVLLQLTVAIEHRAANYFKNKPGLSAKFLRGFSTWGILFISKLIILEAINFLFGTSVVFSGPIHGLIAFIIVVIAIIIAEQMFLKIYKLLA